MKLRITNYELRMGNIYSSVRLQQEVKQCERPRSLVLQAWYDEPGMDIFLPR